MQASAIPARGALFPFRVMYLKEKLYFTSALSSHRQASAVHKGKSACEDNTYARCLIGVAGSLQPCELILSSTLGGGGDIAVSTGREGDLLEQAHVHLG